MYRTYKPDIKDIRLFNWELGYTIKDCQRKLDCKARHLNSHKQKTFQNKFGRVDTIRL